MIWELLPKPIQIVVGIGVFVWFFLLIISAAMTVPSIWLGSLAIVNIATPLVAVNIRKKLAARFEPADSCPYAEQIRYFQRARTTFVIVLAASIFLILVTADFAMVDFAEKRLSPKLYSIETSIDAEGDLIENVEFDTGNSIVDFILNRFTELFLLTAILGLVVIVMMYQSHIGLLNRRAWESEEDTI